MKSSMDDCREGIMIVVIPLLVEKELWGPFDRAIVVDCETETQLIRLMSRDNIDKEKGKNNAAFSIKSRKTPSIK